MICKDCGFKYDKGAECPACGSKKIVEVGDNSCASERVVSGCVSMTPSRGANLLSQSMTAGTHEVYLENDWQTTFDKTERAMAVLYSLNGDECGKGSGFFVNYHGEYFCVTNYHVIENGDVVVVELPTIVDASKQKYNTEIMAVDPLNDIAVLKLQVDIAGIASFENRVALTLSDCRDTKVGQEVCTRGNPRYYTNILTVGRISGVCESSATEALNHFGTNRFLVNIDASNGSSGGAVCNKKGEVVGAVTCCDKEMPNQIICVSAFAITQLIATHIAKRQNKVRG